MVMTTMMMIICAFVAELHHCITMIRLSGDGRAVRAGPRIALVLEKIMLHCLGLKFFILSRVSRWTIDQIW